MDLKPLLAVSMGDPAGVGPEMVVEALVDDEIREICRPLVIGDGAVLEAAIGIKDVEAKIVLRSNPSAAKFLKGTIEVLEMKNVALSSLKRGVLDFRAGQAAFEYVITGAELCLSGKAAGLVTGPINKAALHMAGHDFSGHTEILAFDCKTENVAMMLVAGRLHVSHVSTHVSLRNACDLVSKKRILRVISLTQEMMTRLGVLNPRLAVAGLNPHAGEGGVFGEEEIQEIIPAIETARQSGHDVQGPFPPDTMFYQAMQAHHGERFDAVIAMYHDQGHIPIKLLGFHDGVNVTLGLPILRTSVDHGTAFDIAGTGLADPSSLKAALRLAVRICDVPD